MDDHHGNIARGLGSGRTVLCGGAGSGKTMALAARARLLRERHPDAPILVLCFNASLATQLARAIPADPHTQVATFHDWAQAQLETSGLPIAPPPGRGTLWDRYWTLDQARLLLRAYAEGRLSAGRYRAILVDEGQDFVDDWYRGLLRALDPAGELFVAIDPAQNIYGRTIDWDALGLGASADHRALGDNHRNARVIAEAARRVLAPIDDVGDDASVVGADGPAPEVTRCATFEASRAHALAWVRDRLERGTPARDVLVLGLSRLDMITVNAWLNSKGIAAWLPAVTDRAEGVRVSTIHGAKGLEADAVLLLDAHHLQTREKSEARRLLYIAMTRARRDLAISYFRDVPLMADLAEACAPA